MTREIIPSCNNNLFDSSSSLAILIYIGVGVAMVGAVVAVVLARPRRGCRSTSSPRTRSGAGCRRTRAARWPGTRGTRAAPSPAPALCPTNTSHFWCVIKKVLKIYSVQRTKAHMTPGAGRRPHPLLHGRLQRPLLRPRHRGRQPPRQTRLLQPRAQPQVEP